MVFQTQTHSGAGPAEVLSAERTGLAEIRSESFRGSGVPRDHREADSASSAESIRESTPDTPFLFISGYPLDGVDERSCGVAMRHCLCKPFSAAELAARVRELLDAN